MVDSNSLLYKHASDGKTAKGEHPDHLVVIKYVPTVGDSKVAIDSYVSELFCGGRNTMNIFNECEDSLLATPLILDLTILAELMTRIQVRPLSHLLQDPFRTISDLVSSSLQYRPSPSPESFADESNAEPFKKLYSVLSLLSYMLKAPLVKEGTGVVNSLSRQRQGLEQFLKGAFPSLLLRVMSIVDFFCVTFAACLGLDHHGDLLLETRI